MQIRQRETLSHQRAITPWNLFIISSIRNRIEGASTISAFALAEKDYAQKRLPAAVTMQPKNLYHNKYSWNSLPSYTLKDANPWLHFTHRLPFDVDLKYSNHRHDGTHFGGRYCWAGIGGGRARLWRHHRHWRHNGLKYFLKEHCYSQGHQRG